MLTLSKAGTSQRWRSANRVKFRRPGWDKRYADLTGSYLLAEGAIVRDKSENTSVGLLHKVALSLRRFLFSLVLDCLRDWFLWSPQPPRYMLAESQGFHPGQKRAGIAKRA